ncbi:MAG: glycoside hydrolase family 18 protein [Bacteroidales bacterium]|nr:glycoside hydrolase family 18 protein [Bacteroidales bacterium]MBK8880817.1 glycoside hydrolase family 18 protein [Bacteroidales bacterium]
MFYSLFSLFSCKKDEVIKDSYLTKPECSSSFIPKTYDYQVVGFYPSWTTGEMPVRDIPWEKLTRVVYAFAEPNADGTINTSGLTGIQQLADSAHANGVEIYFSIGGAEASNNFPVMATNAKARDLFIKEVRQFIFANCLDGVDIDWEYWSGYENNVVVPAESNALVTIVKELKSELSPFQLGISIDLGASDWGGKHFMDEIPDYVDQLMVMSYDFSGTWTGPGPHSAFADAIGSGNTINSTGLAYWVNYRGWPKEHILLGVPFYGKDFDHAGGYLLKYSEILNQFPDAYKYDRVNNIYYDGISTMAEKTSYVAENNFSGIMIWEITQDSKVDSTSLLNAIHKVLHP